MVLATWEDAVRIAKELKGGGTGLDVVGHVDRGRGHHAGRAGEDQVRGLDRARNVNIELNFKTFGRPFSTFMEIHLGDLRRNNLRRNVMLFFGN